MQHSKRFILVSLFAGITISALGNNLVSLIDQFLKSGEWASLAYSAALLIFLVKYFVDDLTDENTKQTGKTRGKLILLVLAWVFFLLTALSLKNMLISVVFWLAGLFFVTIFMLKYPSTEGGNDRKCFCPLSGYVKQNIILILFLFVFLLPNLCILLSSLSLVWLNSLPFLCKISWKQACSLVLLLITIIFLFYSATGNNTTGDS